MSCIKNDLLNYHRDDIQFKMADFVMFTLHYIVGTTKWLLEYMYENSLLVFLSVILAIALFVIYKSYVCPDFYSKELTDLGFTHIPSGPDRAARIARARSARRPGAKLPPPYPNGWFALAESCAVKVGGLLPVDALGQNFCVYRGEDGKARCVDAYCPHLGAHLASGAVRGDCVECPFHRWRFDAEGALTDVPGADTVPKGVSIRTWHTVEADGAIWVWYDAEGRPPLWGQHDSPQLNTYKYRGRNEFVVNCHIQEIPENGADVAHLNAVHSESLLTKLGEKYPLLLNFIGHHHWTAEWSKNENHTSSIKLTHDYKMMKINLFHIDVEVIQIGPGHVRLHLQSSFGPVLISQSVTPLSALEQKVVHRVFSPSYNAPMGYILNRAESYQFERDVAIWNNKKFVSAPAYVKADKTIRAFRSWYSQFYSENSISFVDACRNSLDW